MGDAALFASGTGCSVLVCVIIGLPCLLVGCNPDLPGGCATRELLTMTYIGKQLESNVCCAWCTRTVCSEKIDGVGTAIHVLSTTLDNDGDSDGSSSSSSSCSPQQYCCNENYNCYSCQYRFSAINDSNHECGKECGYTYRNSNDAMSAPSKYAIHQSYIFAYDDRTNRCQDADSSKATWIAGVFFLALGASIFLCASLGACVAYLRTCECDECCAVFGACVAWVRVRTCECDVIAKTKTLEMDDEVKIQESEIPLGARDFCSSAPPPPAENPHLLKMPDQLVNSIVVLPVQEKSLSEDSNLCITCNDAKRNVLFQPCCHLSSCMRCYENWRAVRLQSGLPVTCSQCRAPILTVQTVYLS